MSIIADIYPDICLFMGVIGIKLIESLFWSPIASTLVEFKVKILNYKSYSVNELTLSSLSLIRKLEPIQCEEHIT